MKMKKGIAVILGAVLLLNSAACVPVKESLPEDTIEAYEDACNAMDIQAMLDCIDEKSVKSITAGMDLVMGIAGAVTGVDLGISASDMIDLAPLMQAMMGESFAAQMGEIPKVDFQVKETYIKGDRATVYFTEANSGENMVINMVKDSGKWYMTLSTVMISKEEADRVIIAGEEKSDERPDEQEAVKAEKEKKNWREMSINSLFGDKEKIKEALNELVDFMGGASCTVKNNVIYLSGFPNAKSVSLDEYPVDSVYPNEYEVMIDGKSVYLGGAQCMGFVRYVQYKMYGESDLVNAESFEDILGGNALSAEQLKEGTTLKDIITKAGPGAHIRTGNKQHSMMVTEITDEGFGIIHANGNGDGKVKVETFTWDDYNKTWGKRGILSLKVHKQ